jgi:hypothetical protein
MLRLFVASSDVAARRGQYDKKSLMCVTEKYLYH